MNDIEQKLFMTAKDFAALIGASRCKVMDWIHQGLPVMPDQKKPYRVFVPEAQEWIRKRITRGIL
jgi:phage terminase Nu1 subunit (DNA packaging protein)